MARKSKGRPFSSYSKRSQARIRNSAAREGVYPRTKEWRNYLAKLRRGTKNPFKLGQTKRVNILVQTRDGIRSVTVQATQAERQTGAIHRNLVKHYLATGDSTALENFVADPHSGRKGKRLPNQIGGYTLASDLDDIDIAYDADPEIFDADDYYPDDDK